MMAKENITFRKYPVIHALESHHGVDLGQAYATKDSAKSFTHYIAESQRQEFHRTLSSAHFYSFLMDSTTDAGNIEDELIVILYCEKDDAAGEIKSCARYFTVDVPKKADANGLIACLGTALKNLGVEDVLDKASVLSAAAENPIVVGGGTDGASVCIGEHNGMKGKLQRAIPWLFWAWCFAHRLELACKNALSSPLLASITEMLLQLYYCAFILQGFTRNPQRVAASAVANRGCPLRNRPRDPHTYVNNTTRQTRVYATVAGHGSER